MIFMCYHSRVNPRITVKECFHMRICIAIHVWDTKNDYFHTSDWQQFTYSDTCILKVEVVKLFCYIVISQYFFTVSLPCRMISIVISGFISHANKTLDYYYKFIVLENSSFHHTHTRNNNRNIHTHQWEQITKMPTTQEQDLNAVK